MQFLPVWYHTLNSPHSVTGTSTFSVVLFLLRMDLDLFIWNLLYVLFVRLFMFNRVQLHLLLHSYSKHTVEHTPVNDQTPQDFLRFLSGVAEASGRTSFFLHWALGKGFLSQQTKGPSVPVAGKVWSSFFEILFSQTDADPSEEGKNKKWKKKKGKQQNKTTRWTTQTPEEDI